MADLPLGERVSKLPALFAPPPAFFSATRTRQWLETAATAFVLLLHAWMGLSASRHESPTVDEMAHLTAGHAIWAAGDYRLQPENGVLPQLWEGLPGWLGGARLPPRSNPGWTQPNVWTLGDAYFHHAGNDLSALLRQSRAMNMGWSLATGLLVFAWTRRWFGAAGAWIALLFWAFSPTFLAHGALATSDMALTFFMLAAVGAYWRHLNRPGWRAGALSAVLVALAFVAKYSAVLLIPMLALLAGAKVFLGSETPVGGCPAGARSSLIRRILASAVAHVAVVIVVIWAFHGFRYLPVRDPALIEDYTRPWSVVLGSLGTPLAPVLARARQFHLLPDAYLYGFAFVVDLSRERGAFLNGETSLTGWVQFFPYAFLVKSTLALLLATGAALVASIASWREQPIRRLRTGLYRLAPLLVLFGVYWAFSLTSHLNIGQRHLLPIYPVLFIALGALGAAIGARPWVAAVVAALVLAQVTASLRIRPHYLAFFNVLSGGPAEGYRHLVDSSLDWGQDLPGLAEWLREQPARNRAAPVYLAYFGTGDPEYYGIHAISMVPLLRKTEDRPWYRLEAGAYCVSATLLSQAYSPIRDAWSLNLEGQYQRLRGIEPALLDYWEHPERRPAWEKEIPAARWPAMWGRYEQLRFTRLCYYLRARAPDAQIGYSINVYRLTSGEIAAATGDLKAWTAAIEAASRSRPPHR